MKNNLLLTVFALALGNLASVAHDWTGSRPDGHAPIGVMGDHYHGKNEWMFSYRYMFMAMDGNRNGNDQLTVAQTAAAGPFGVVPLKMVMQMHMLGVMYAPSDHLTLMGMLPYNYIEM
ncbi:MAG: transporter, partial [Limisphaerales bacterium]